MKRFILAVLMLGLLSPIHAADVQYTGARPDLVRDLPFNYRNIDATNYATTTDAVPFHNYVHLTSSGTVKATRAFLGCITINKAGTAPFAVYDDTAAVNTANLIADFAASSVVGTYCYNTLVSTGIQVNVSGVAGPDITLTYR